MHPGDVAEFIRESVADLERLLATDPTLGGPPILEDTDLYIPFVKKTRPLVDATLATGIIGPGGDQVSRAYTVPLLGQPPVERGLLLHMNLDDFDGQPPTAELLLLDRSPLPPQDWPRSTKNQGIILSHRDFRRPFFCRRGLREFHTHPQHEDEPWDLHREGLTLAKIANELLTGLRDTWIGN